jgi:heme/copper-type cytochrome/quinol oxidase subunit 2
MPGSSIRLAAMLLGFLHLLAQTPVEQAQKKTAAEEGKDIVLAMLVVGLVFVGMVVLGDLWNWRSRKRRARRSSGGY